MLDVEENAFYCIGLDHFRNQFKTLYPQLWRQIVARGAAPAPGDSFQPEEVVEIFYRMYQRLAIQAKIPMEKLLQLGLARLGRSTPKPERSYSGI